VTVPASTQTDSNHDEYFEILIRDVRARRRGQSARCGFSDLHQELRFSSRTPCSGRAPVRFPAPAAIPPMQQPLSGQAAGVVRVARSFNRSGLLLLSRRLAEVGAVLN